MEQSGRPDSVTNYITTTPSLCTIFLILIYMLMVKCLLGTWHHGDSSEKWDPVQSTLMQVWNNEIKFYSKIEFWLL